ncbi:hypothetical protein ES703_78601 [subsurface metagenome]
MSAATFQSVLDKLDGYAMGELDTLFAIRWVVLTEEELQLAAEKLRLATEIRGMMIHV